MEHCYLDGSMAPAARQVEIDRFQGSAGIPVFLLSLKAGGSGLNLTGADTVIHFDPWWNPAAEAQATDRAHRIGQTRVVTSYRLVCPGTVEEKVLALQDEKRALLAGVFEASDAAAQTISLADLKALLTPAWAPDTCGASAAMPMAATPAPMSAQVDGSGTGVKLRKMSLLPDETQNVPKPIGFAKGPMFRLKSAELKPEIDEAERRRSPIGRPEGSTMFADQAPRCPG